MAPVGLPGRSKWVVESSEFLGGIGPSPCRLIGLQFALGRTRALCGCLPLYGEERMSAVRMAGAEGQADVVEQARERRS